MNNCERCGTATIGYQLWDYCAVCSKNLCDQCIETGCCGNQPATIEMDEDIEENIN